MTKVNEGFVVGSKRKVENTHFIIKVVCLTRHSIETSTLVSLNQEISKPLTAVELVS